MVDQFMNPEKQNQKQASSSATSTVLAIKQYIIHDQEVATLKKLCEDLREILCFKGNGASDWTDWVKKVDSCRQKLLSYFQTCIPLVILKLIF